MRALHENIQKVQNQQKQYVDQRRVEQSFEIGDMVFMMLQPYRQSSLRKKGSKKLKPCYYGPFRIIRRFNEVAYELDLPADSKVNNVFHVSLLKKALGQQIAPSSDLPPPDDEGKLILVPEVVIETKERHLRRILPKSMIESSKAPDETGTSWISKADIPRKFEIMRKSKDIHEIYIEDQEPPQSMEEDHTPEIQRKTRELVEDNNPNETLDPTDVPIDIVVNRKIPLSARKMIQEAEGFATPKGTFRESKRPHRFSIYAALMSEIIESKPTSVEEASSLQVWKDAMA
ncbi:uncharacterized protein LOC131857013 [Cryptomeria japonica]|uniref:uncharacterized protein LOC131857013 n=1 Tax=Cryptomeria japonica TaxID=3369 RepID=UPI0027D9D3FD|nr:uncharacterized protein LOC131857013 [Cryptomeria japonica]